MIMTNELVKGYTLELIEALNKCTEDDDPRIRQLFKHTSGKRYLKIIQDVGGVHAFIDASTGDVYKPAGWAKPAKHIRYNLLDKESRERCLKNADQYGSYLYMR